VSLRAAADPSLASSLWVTRATSLSENERLKYLRQVLEPFGALGIQVAGSVGKENFLYHGNHNNRNQAQGQVGQR
jgi:hypothetical protein